jgi:hypothetical protein
MPAARPISIALAAFLFAGAAAAETRIFLVDGSDGYGIDRCLASGERCGEAAASALCRARDYARAIEFGRLDSSGITGGVPAGANSGRCQGLGCADTVAITCSR